MISRFPCPRRRFSWFSIQIRNQIPGLHGFADVRRKLLVRLEKAAGWKPTLPEGAATRWHCRAVTREKRREKRRGCGRDGGVASLRGLFRKQAPKGRRNCGGMSAAALRLGLFFICFLGFRFAPPPAGFGSPLRGWRRAARCAGPARWKQNVPPFAGNGDVVPPLADPARSARLRPGRSPALPLGGRVFAGERAGNGDVVPPLADPARSARLRPGRSPALPLGGRAFAGERAGNGDVAPPVRAGAFWNAAGTEDGAPPRRGQSVPQYGMEVRGRGD